jgi:hypothetical protein
VKLDAQVLATALSVYVTNATLDSTQVAAQYGFTVSGDGVGTATVNVGSNGDAFGVANNTVMTVLDLLLATDAQAVNGVLYNGNTTKRNHANNVYSAVNQAGDISCRFSRPVSLRRQARCSPARAAPGSPVRRLPPRSTAGSVDGHTGV